MARRVPLAEPAKAIEIIQEDGCAILTGFTSLDDLKTVNGDAEPFVAAMDPPHNPNELLICTRLFGRSETAREKWMQNPSLRKILNHFLRTTTSSIYVDDTSGKPNFAVDPILSNSNTIVRLPGAPVAGFHRDSDPWQQFNYDRQKTGFMHGADIAATVLVPGIDMSAENGGTLVSMADEFIPKSHLWGHEMVPRGEDATAADAKAGEAFFILGSLIHSGGPNISQQRRPLHSFFWIRSYLRPEDNQHLSWKKEEVERWSVAAQTQAGFRIGNPNIGHTDWKDPILMIKA